MTQRTKNGAKDVCKVVQSLLKHPLQIIYEIEMKIQVFKKILDLMQFLPSHEYILIVQQTQGRWWSLCLGKKIMLSVQINMKISSFYDENFFSHCHQCFITIFLVDELFDPEIRASKTCFSSSLVWRDKTTVCAQKSWSWH